MAPNSKTRSGGGFFDGLLGRKSNTQKPNSTNRKPNRARTFGERFAPLRSLAGYGTQKRLIARNVKATQEKINAAKGSIEAAKAKNLAYNTLNSEYEEAKKDQQKKWEAYTAAKSRVYDLLMKRQAASKGIVDRVKGVFRHGLSGLFTRKSYEQNVKANINAVQARKNALVARAGVVERAQEEEKRKQADFDKSIKEQNEEADKILKDATNTLTAKELSAENSNSLRREMDPKSNYTPPSSPPSSPKSKNHSSP